MTCKRCGIGKSSDDDGYCLSCQLFSAKDRILTLERQFIVETCSLESELRAARAQVATLTEALRDVLGSATPFPGEHPAMCRAWDRARAALKAAGVEV